MGYDAGGGTGSAGCVVGFFRSGAPGRQRACRVGESSVGQEFFCCSFAARTDKKTDGRQTGLKDCRYRLRSDVDLCASDLSVEVSAFSEESDIGVLLPFVRFCRKAGRLGEVLGFPFLVGARCKAFRRKGSASGRLLFEHLFHWASYPYLRLLQAENVGYGSRNVKLHHAFLENQSFADVLA